MSTEFSLEFLQGKIGAEYVELNPITGKPRIVQGLNQVWEAIDEHGGVSVVAKLFGLSEVDVWGWIDDHVVPDLYAPYLASSRPTDRYVREMQLSSVGYEDPMTKVSWPVSWPVEWTFHRSIDLGRRGSLPSRDVLERHNVVLGGV